MNVDKTKFITFALTKRAFPNIHCLVLHDKDCHLNKVHCKCSNLIKRQESWKYLGILIDETLTWKNHISYVSDKRKKINIQIL